MDVGRETGLWLFGCRGHDLSSDKSVKQSVKVRVDLIQVFPLDPPTFKGNNGIKMLIKGVGNEEWGNWNDVGEGRSGIDLPNFEPVSVRRLTI